MPRFFFNIQYIIPESDSALLAGRCIMALHYQLINCERYNIGVCFPEWSQTALGRSIAFVSYDLEKLFQLRNDQYFSLMASEGLFNISEIENVAEGSEEEVRFIRNQSIKKIFAGEKRRRLERAKRRAANRGEIFYPENLKVSYEIEFFHSVLVNSESTGQSYLLHIQRQQLSHGTMPSLRRKREDFNTYGLATNQKFRGTVPRQIS